MKIVVNCFHKITHRCLSGSQNTFVFSSLRIYFHLLNFPLDISFTSLIDSKLMHHHKNGMKSKETKTLSVCFFIKLNETIPPNKVIHLINEKYFLMDIWLTKDQIIFSVEDYHCFIITVQQIAVKRWEHICGTWESKGLWKVYINGRIYQTGKETHKNETLNRIANSNINNTAPGEISQLFVYSVVLNSHMIQKVHTEQPPNKHLIVNWIDLLHFKSTL